MLKSFLTLTMFFLSFSTSAQGQGAIAGKVIEEATGEEMINAKIIIKQEGVIVYSASTDFEGYYRINIEEGKYEVTIEYPGLNYPPQDSIIVVAKKTTLVYFPPRKHQKLGSNYCNSPIQFPKVTGKITDEETGEEILGANIVLTQGGEFLKATTSDAEGNYELAVLRPGIYNLKVNYLSVNSKQITGIILKQNETVHLSISLSPEEYPIPDCKIVRAILIRIINADETTSGIILHADEIRSSPTKSIDEFLWNSPGVSGMEW